ncbi:MAG: response regulator transcription factor, partial [Cyanobacteriota bacterium]
VEDDPDLRQALLALLHSWGYALAAAADGPEALAITTREAIDLVLLDVGLPGCDGLTVCRELRRRAGHQPLVLMLTARDGTDDKVRGLELGADDYVVKPFDPPVLRARLQALLRRRDRPLTTELRWGPLALVPGQTCLRLGDSGLELTRKEALLLEQLLRSGGDSLSKGELLHGIGDGRREVGEDALRAHMRNLRQKLMAAGCAANLIETVYGLGYRVNPTAAA